MVREHVEGVVTIEDGRLGTNGGGPNKTIDHLAKGFPFPATEVIERATLAAIRWKGGRVGLGQRYSLALKILCTDSPPHCQAQPL